MLLNPSNCWRGYVATWAFTNDALFLVHLSPPGEDELGTIPEKLIALHSDAPKAPPPGPLDEIPRTRGLVVGQSWFGGQSSLDSRFFPGILTRDTRQSNFDRLLAPREIGLDVLFPNRGDPIEALGKTIEAPSPAAIPEGENKTPAVPASGSATPPPADATTGYISDTWNDESKKAVRDQVLISYSHQDKRFLERLMKHLKPAR
jgi:hypothetical protein